MDITPLFKANIKTLRIRQTTLGLTIGGNSNLLNDNKKTISNSSFSKKAIDIVTSISTIKIFLEENRKEYVNIKFLVDDSNNFSDVDRNERDRNAETFINTCEQVIKKLKEEAKETKSKQLSEHQVAVIDILNKYLSSVNQVYKDQKDLRKKRENEKQNLGRLSLPIKKTQQSSNDVVDNKPDWSILEGKPGAIKENLEFSTEDAQMFEEENKALYEEMNSLGDQVKVIEGKMFEIFKLQEMFSEKVIEQDQDINRISDTIVGATENIKEGNDELREAMKTNAGFRIWILFFLIVLSFTLLFLDWYNP